MRPAPKPPTFRDKDYLKYVGGHPCTACGAEEVDVHHLAGKTNDFATVPWKDAHRLLLNFVRGQS